MQESRTARKICKLDHHLVLAFAGLTADARVLVNKARIECQSYRLTVEDACTVEYISRHIAKIQQVLHAEHGNIQLVGMFSLLWLQKLSDFVYQQKFTQRGGRRPFGIATLIVGFDPDGTPQLYQTNPSGTYSSWKVSCAQYLHSSLHVVW